MNQELPPLRVYILAYNRPEYVVTALNSVLSQDYPRLEVVVSNNSTQKEVGKILSEINDSRLKIISRNPSLPAIAHFNAVLEDAKDTEFFMLFHDDDELLPNALSELIVQFDAETAAVGSNAFVILNDEKKNYTLKQTSEDRVLKRPLDVVESYFAKGKWHAAFPSYIYRSSCLKSIRMDTKKGGKYTDVLFLVDICKHSQIKMISKPQLYYRLHQNNDSKTFDAKAFFSLSRNLCLEINDTPSYLVNTKYKVYLRDSLQKYRQRAPFKFRSKVLLKHAVTHIIKNPSLILEAFIRKLTSKT